MRRWLQFGSWALAVLLITGLGLETRRLAELAGRFEIAARQAQRESGVAQQQARAAQQAAEATASAANQAAQQHAVTADALARLEAQVAAGQAELQAMSAALQQRNEELTKAAEAAAAANAHNLAPIPEGVRTCLRALHECLRTEGFANQRFLSAQSLDEEGLHEVEMLQQDPEGLIATFVHAGRMVAQLDRGAGRLELRFFDGTRSDGGERTALPKDGWPILFAPVDGHRFEERLPFLVRAVGAYPAPSVSGRERAPSDVDVSTQRQWLERFDHLLGQVGPLTAVGPAQFWRVTRFRGMQDGAFLTVELVGTDSKFRVLSSAYCARLSVEVDRHTNVVSLLLQDGVLHNGDIESSITAEGYRMLLPNLTAKQASDAMFGMVVSK